MRSILSSLKIIKILLKCELERGSERPGWTNCFSARLEEMYDGDMMNLDLYVGGMLESYGGPGPLFTKIIKDQFERLRDADRFWFENKENGLFTEEEISALKKLKLSDIILAVTDIQRGHIQENVFLWQTGDPCPQPHQLNATEMDPCMFLKGEH